MWKTKTFKTKAAWKAFIARIDGTCQWEEIYVNNGYGVQYKRLIVVY